MIFHQRYGSWKRRSQAYSNGHEGKHTGGTLTVTPQAATLHTLYVGCRVSTCRWGKVTENTISLGNTYLYRFEILEKDHTKREITLLL